MFEGTVEVVAKLSFLLSRSITVLSVRVLVAVALSAGCSFGQVLP
jgi:hypothetical protein